MTDRTPDLCTRTRRADRGHTHRSAHAGIRAPGRRTRGRRGSRARQSERLSADRSRVLEEWLEVLAYDLMKKRLLRLVPCVGNRIVIAGTGLVWKPLRNWRAGSRGERKHLTPCPVASPAFEVGRSRPLVHGASVNGGSSVAVRSGLGRMERIRTHRKQFFRYPLRRLRRLILAA